MEWAELIAFISKWWLEFVLAAVGTGLGLLCRHYYKLVQKGKAQEAEDKKEAFKAEIKVEVGELLKDVRKSVHQEIQKESSQVREEIAENETNDCQRITGLENRADILEDTLGAVVETLDVIKGGLLAVQGHEFRNKCRKLLRQDLISYDEYEQLESDHTAYNSLGGNHKGDSLFDQVKTKYYAQLKEQ